MVYTIGKRKVSIHTPTQGVTSLRNIQPLLYGCFNPHTHAGCDDDAASGKGDEYVVSIHTPTQGVTICGMQRNE